MTTHPPSSSSRFAFIDAWRGIASLAVMIGHHYVHSPYLSSFDAGVPTVLRELIWRSGLAVVVFFVISGFVIAYSLRSLPMDAGVAGRFAIRRQVRLDPVYWVAICVSLFVLAIDQWVGGYAEGAFGFREIVINVLYLQNLFDVREAVSNAWTLCIEIQFYLVFVLILWVCRLIRGPCAIPASRGLETCLIFGLSAAGLLMFGTEYGRVATFLPVWVYFGLGVVASWAVVGQLAGLVAWLSIAAVTVTAAVTRSEELAVGAATTAMFLSMGQANQLVRYWNGVVLQFFGRISCSLYIIHVPIGCHLVMKAGYKLTGPSVLWGVIWAVVGMTVSVVVAGGVYWCVERPSQRWAARIPRSGRRPKAAKCFSECPCGRPM